ncbi:MAG: LD-carboxypeptidase, partial [Bacteroidota bacterium]
MQRRRFLLASGTLAAGLAFANGSPALGKGLFPPNRPERLKKGDSVGIITPGSALSAEDFEEALENVRTLGLNPVPMKYANTKYGFLGGTDFQRISDLHEAFANPDIKGVVCARGGYGTGRIVNELDYELIRKNPKVLLGFSDITALLNAIYQKTGLICFHGPVGASKLTDFTRSSIEETLFEGAAVNLKASGGYTIKGGSAKGKLVGGNLSLITSLMGTPHEINMRKKVVLVEDVGESPYRIDRMLTQLINAASFQGARALVFGDFNNCDIDPSDPESKGEFTLRQVLTERCALLEMPVYYGMSFGHLD